MREDNFKPINFSKFREAWQDKNQEKNKPPEMKELTRIRPIQTKELEQSIYHLNSYIRPYFLDNLPELELPDIEQNDDTEEEEDEFEKIEGKALWQNLMEDFIKKNKDRPFMIDLPFWYKRNLIEKGLIASDSGYFYYIPKELGKDIERYNKYLSEKEQKDSDESLAEIVNDINLN